MEKTFTCIICPRGCRVFAKWNGEDIEKVDGYSCKRGMEYVKSEITHPVRSITSTVMCESGRLISVKTSRAVPKEMVWDVMDEIKSATAKRGIVSGETVIGNVLGTGADIIATASDIEF